LRNRHKKKLMGLPLRSILRALAVAMAVAALLLYVFQDRTPPQEQAITIDPDEAALIVPLPPGETCLAVPEPTPEPEATYDPYPELGDKVGTITLPSLDLSWPIFEGTDAERLALGVGHYIGSVLPGVVDNSILSGHRDTVFSRIGELEAGDLILVETAAGVFTYEMTDSRVVDRSDQTVIQPSDDAKLTLTTCYPFAAIGATTQAYILSAKLISSIYKED
jgi:LPXTG-site transpeptidase (sortase) family protein